jgi:LPXTG-motif cell wall-anchored protein
MEAWLPAFVEKVTSSPAWDANSVMFITLDEGAATDTSGCSACHDTSAGGRIGALVISAMAAPGASGWQGDHYGFVRTLETSFGLPTLAATAAAGGPLPAGVRIHDADPGVSALTDVWRAPAVVGAVGAPGAPPATVAGEQITATGGRRELPATGSRSQGEVGVGGAALAVGLGLALRARRRLPGSPSTSRRRPAP